MLKIIIKIIKYHNNNDNKQNYQTKIKQPQRQPQQNEIFLLINTLILKNYCNCNYNNYGKKLQMREEKINYFFFYIITILYYYYYYYYFFEYLMAKD